MSVKSHFFAIAISHDSNLAKVEIRPPNTRVRHKHKRTGHKTRLTSQVIHENTKQFSTW